ncbi:MAG: MFS transporter [Pseudomonadota bacterium]
MSGQIGFKTKVVYGFGNASNGIKESAFSSFLIFYYVQVVGVSASLAGFVALCALAVDAISDPVIGHWSDRFRSRWGRRHPFMYASALPLGLSMYFLFSPPEGLEGSAAFLWMLVFAVSVRLWISFYAIPSSAMLAEMTSDYHERTRIVNLRGLFSWSGGIGLSFIAYRILFQPTDAYADGRLNPEAYQTYGLLAAFAIIISILLSSLGTHHLIPILIRRMPEPGAIRGIFTEFRSIFQTTAFRILFLATLIGSVTNGVLDTLRLFVNTYFWGFSSEQLSLLLFGMIGGMVTSFLCLRFLSHKTEKKPLILLFMAITVVAWTLPIVMRLAGLLPENGTQALFVIIFLATGAQAFGGFGAIAMAASMLADVVDVHHLSSGSRLEGMHFSTFAFSAKATTGIGGFIAGIGLDLISFPAKAEPGQVPADTIFALGVMNALVVGVTLCLSLLLLVRYPIDKNRHSEVLAALRLERKLSQ